MSAPESERVDADGWAPDARWALPAVVTVWAWAAGWLPQWSATTGAPFPPWLMALLGALVALVGVWRARTTWPLRTHGEVLREQGTLLAVVAGIALGTWLVLAGYTSPWQQTPLLLLIAAVGGAWYAALVTSAPRHAAETAEHVEIVTEQGEVAALRSILDDSSCADVKVINYEHTRGGYTATLGPDASYSRRPKFSDVSAKMADLALNLGIYWRDRDGTVLGDGDVRLEMIAVDRWLLHVSTKHVLREVVRYTPADMPESFNGPIFLGMYEDGTPMMVRLLGNHMKVVGATGGGKSVIINNIIARCLECRTADARADGIVMVCGTEKIVPLVFPWLQPWFEGQTSRPVLHAVIGEEEADVLDFLVRIYDLARDRNTRLTRKSKHTATPTLPGITVIVEEAKALADSKQTVHMGNDVHWTVSKLLAKTAAIARSAAISIVLVSQSGIFDALGSHGADLQRHLTVRACTVTMTQSDGQSTLPRLPAFVDTTKITDYGMYLQVGITEQSRAMPGKACALDEDRVPPVAIALSNELASLSPREVDIMGGDEWLSRWDRDRCPTLVAACESDDEETGWVGRPWPTVGQQPAPVHTTPEDAPMPEPTTPAHDDVDEFDGPMSADWDAELAALLGEPVDEPAPQPADDEPLRRGAMSANHGLPTAAEVDALNEHVERMRQEADAMMAQPAPEPAPVVPLPRPLREVIAYLDRMPEPPEWVSTYELAGAVFGDDVENGSTKMGQALARNVKGLRATDPREIEGTGRRGRGFLVADLYRAAVAIRDGVAEQ